MKMRETNALGWILDRAFRREQAAADADVDIEKLD